MVLRLQIPVLFRKRWTPRAFQYRFIVSLWYCGASKISKRFLDLSFWFLVYYLSAYDYLIRAYGWAFSAVRGVCFCFCTHSHNCFLINTAVRLNWAVHRDNKNSRDSVFRSGGWKGIYRPFQKWAVVVLPFPSGWCGPGTVPGHRADILIARSAL